MDACTLLQDIPQTGELYIGDAAGRPMGLDGVMALVYERRWQHYLDHRDQKRQGEAKWTDNTLRFAAEVYNGGLPVVGRYAHTARVIYDKHWDGRNRTKNPMLTAEEQEELGTCQLCGGMDSQAHVFRWCSHSNISALDAHVDNIRKTPLGSDTSKHRKQHLLMAEGVIQELTNCADASRAWTGNWDDIMIRRVERKADLRGLTKKQCEALRVTLREMYEIISQGGNDILEVRHAMQEVQRQYAMRQGALLTRIQGQRSIRDWLVNSRGVQGAKAKQLEITALMDADEDICDSVGSCSEDDDNIYTDEGPQGHLTYVQESWIPRISAEVQTSMIGRLQEDNGQQIAATRL